MAWASAALPGVASAGLSTACAGAALSTAYAGVARATRTVGRRLLIMFTLPLFECPRSRDATNVLEPPKTCRSQARGARWRGFRCRVSDSSEAAAEIRDLLARHKFHARTFRRFRAQLAEATRSA